MASPDDRETRGPIEEDKRLRDATQDKLLQGMVRAIIEFLRTE
jgi:hypothetical protein